jgi:hypothetical protein
MKRWLVAILLLPMNGCVDYRWYPEPGQGRADPDDVYRTGIEGQGIEVKTWIRGTEYESQARSMDRRQPNPNPDLAKAAERVAIRNCPNGRTTIDQDDLGPYLYTIRYVCIR